MCPFSTFIKLMDPRSPSSFDTWTKEPGKKAFTAIGFCLEVFKHF